MTYLVRDLSSAPLFIGELGTRGFFCYQAGQEVIINGEHFR
jgi:hypothetical protein